MAATSQDGKATSRYVIIVHKEMRREEHENVYPQGVELEAERAAAAAREAAAASAAGPAPRARARKGKGKKGK